MRLPRKKKKELKKLYKAANAFEAIRMAASILTKAFDRYGFNKKDLSQLLTCGIVEECNEVDNETLSKLRTREDR